MAGWVPVDADGWFLDRNKIAGPWPRSLAVLDLRFWDDPIACSKRPRPSARALAIAWGWNRNTTNRLIKNREAWVDEGREKLRHDRASAVPVPCHDRATTVPEASHSAGVEGGLSAEAVPVMGHDRATSEPPPIETHARSPSPPPSQAPSPTQGKVSAAPTGDQLTLTGSTVPETAPPGKPAALPAPKKLSGEPQKTTFGPADKRRAAQRIYDAYRVHHPEEPETPLGSGKGQITARLTELAQASKGKRPRYEPSDWTAAECDLIDLIEWYHVAPRSQWWRDNDNLGVGTLFRSKNFGDRIRDLNTWRNGGRRTDAPKAARRGADAHDFNDLSDLDDAPRDFIDAEYTTEKGGHLGR